jgi:predicted Zn-dependent protease
MNEKNWQAVATSLLSDLKEGEALALSLAAEDSLFVRMTQAKVRQSTEVHQGFVELNFFKNNRNLKTTVPFSFQQDQDLKVCQEALQQCRKEVLHLPEDPLLQWPADHGSFHQEAPEKVHRASLVEGCLDKVQGLDFVGLLSVGEIVRANLNSKGLAQWFGVSTFLLDFSLYAENQQSVKGIYGGTRWQDDEYENIISKKRTLLEHVGRPLMTLEKKKYRVYFSPSAVRSLIEAVSYTYGRKAYESGESALKKLADGEKTLSPLFSLRENFASGDMPRFNEIGEIAPEILDLVEKGAFRNFLCSSRSAKEYGAASNFAGCGESLRAPEILPGHLLHDKEMETLGTGVYVSNLHYLNWSNVLEGSLTGMTRFGCFWVENGQIVAPVKDMRFDESLYHFWGQGLEGFTDKTETFPKTGTYGQRDLGPIKTPGMLVNDFTFVL